MPDNLKTAIEALLAKWDGKTWNATELSPIINNLRDALRQLEATQTQRVAGSCLHCGHGQEYHNPMTDACPSSVVTKWAKKPGKLYRPAPQPASPISTVDGCVWKQFSSVGNYHCESCDYSGIIAGPVETSGVNYCSGCGRKIKFAPLTARLKGADHE